MQEAEIFSWIRQQIQGSPIVLFMKGIPEAPQCGFSFKVVETLQRLGVPFEGINVLSSPELRQGIKDYSDWPTIPQLYIKGEFIGGCDIIMEMYKAGELEILLKNHKLLASVS